MRPRAGFTIIELMLVIGIIGIIATIAIPMMLGFKLRSKAAEGKTDLSTFSTAPPRASPGPSEPASRPGSSIRPTGHPTV